MKTLYLVRHAKSSWKDETLDDYDRPLNKRGNQDAPFMGNLLSMKKIAPDLLISSPAKRAAKTAEFFSKQLEYDNEKIKFEEKLYAASKSEILAIINQQPDEIDSIMLFAHNPGLTDLANFLCGANIDNIPTAGVAAMKLKNSSWKDLNKDGAELEFFEFPKKYK